MAKFQISAALLVIAFLTIASANSAASDDDCPAICPDNYDPLCAFNGKVYKEFENACSLKYSNCRLERSNAAQYLKVIDEWCSTEFVEDLYEKLGKPDLTKRECFHPCHMMYAPVCVSNGIYRASLSNECLMETYNKCLGNKIKPLKVLAKGTC